MKNILSLIIASCYLVSCSTSPSDNGGINTTVVPAAPTNLTATVASTTHVNLTWTDNASNELGFKVQRKIGNGNYSVVGSTGADSMSFSDINLIPGISFTYRVYSYNIVGNSLAYSNEVTVNTNSYTPGPNLTDINGNVYSSITTSCGQTWISKNLTVSRYRNGDIIPQVTDPSQWESLTTGAWCWYKNDSATYGSTYGRLYNWYAVNDIRGLAPAGWHMPTDAEWNKLIKCIDPNADTTQCCSNVAGTDMKSISGWNGEGNGNNSSGFAGLPSGYRFIDGAFGAVGDNGFWWSASEIGAMVAQGHYLGSTSNAVRRNLNSKRNGFSVRVIRD